MLTCPNTGPAILPGMTVPICKLICGLVPDAPLKNSIPALLSPPLQAISGRSPRSIMEYTGVLQTPVYGRGWNSVVCAYLLEPPAVPEARTVSSQRTVKLHVVIQNEFATTDKQMPIPLDVIKRQTDMR